MVMLCESDSEKVYCDGRTNNSKPLEVTIIIQTNRCFHILYYTIACLFQ